LREGQGKEMATLKQENAGPVFLDEAAILGSDRLGSYIPTSEEAYTLGQRQYHLKDHLGNIRITLNDRRLKPQGSIVFLPDLISGTEYYPFGMASNTFGTKPNRLGYNGKENDDVLGMQDYGFRLYDPVKARFGSVDPLLKKFPWYSTYQYAGNMPISSNDLDGLEPAWAKALWDVVASGFNQVLSKVTGLQIQFNTTSTIGIAGGFDLKVRGAKFKPLGFSAKINLASAEINSTSNTLSSSGLDSKESSIGERLKISQGISAEATVFGSGLQIEAEKSFTAGTIPGSGLEGSHNENTKFSGGLKVLQFSLLAPEINSTERKFDENGTYQGSVKEKDPASASFSFEGGAILMFKMELKVLPKNDKKPNDKPAE